MSKAFVIHIHSGYGPLHYDLMLQHEQSLATWRFDASPADIRPDQVLPAHRIRDHRLAYLSYEGPVSGGRGRVDVLDRGGCVLVSADESRWEIALTGKLLRGRFELMLADPKANAWTFRRLSEDRT